MEMLCDGGEEVDETALLQLLALSCNQTLLIIVPLHFTYLEYSIFVYLVTFRPPWFANWAQLNSLLHDRLLLSLIHI